MKATEFELASLNSTFQRLLLMSSHHGTFIHTHTHVNTCTAHMHPHLYVCTKHTNLYAKDTWAKLKSEEGLGLLPVTCSYPSGKSLDTQTHAHTHTHINIYTHISFLPSKSFAWSV